MRNLSFVYPESRDDIPSSAGRYLQKQLSKLIIIKMLVILVIHYYNTYMYVILYTNNERKGLFLFLYSCSILGSQDILWDHPRKNKISKLEEEYEEFQITQAAERPKYIKNEGRLDEYWGQVNLITKDPRFPFLSRLATAMLTIPNSDADCKRVSSMARKIQTGYRSDMYNSTLSSLLCAKINAKETCCHFQPSKALLGAAKRATYNYNKEHPTRNENQPKDLTLQL